MSVPDPRTGGLTPIERILIVIPTYDEVGNLEGTVARVRHELRAADILIVDDNSPDGTGALADNLSAEDRQVHVLHRQGKEGLGRAYVAGFHWALDHDYTIIVEMDADGSHQPEELPALLAGLHGVDAVVGARWVAGGDVRDWSRSRVWLSRAANRYVRIMLAIDLNDATSGFRAYRAGVLRTVDLTSVESTGYCFQIDVSRRVVRAGFTVREVPITFVERTVGDSKMSGGVFFESLVNVTRWGIADRFTQVRRAVSRSFRRTPNTD
ncbi:dolichol-phosphate mannosyltransferase [Antricoccus suffuscus]|uniref:Dolichol-phosphate mannosyltransferase n=1 Tax=Antricoccus suffuscus TaxID=1629062 RepID=A0A2T1A0K0_9ACTN|nr:polyprenol monophosphomannose synthase [Antricoccus suffuscus]PRZ42132.1 dolichol-phosphate mannosyltransferase [Antricoccus suffuscus]